MPTARKLVQRAEEARAVAEQVRDPGCKARDDEFSVELRTFGKACGHARGKGGGASPRRARRKRRSGA